MKIDQITQNGFIIEHLLWNTYGIHIPIQDQLQYFNKRSAVELI